MVKQIYQTLLAMLKIVFICIAFFLLHILIQVPAVSSLPDLGENTTIIIVIRIVLLLTVIPITMLLRKYLNCFFRGNEIFSCIQDRTITRKDIQIIIEIAVIDLIIIGGYIIIDGMPEDNSLCNVLLNNPLISVLSILTMVFTQPFLEEFLYRGILLGGLKYYSRVMAVIVSSFVFSYVHVYNYHEVINLQLIGGLIYGFTFLKAKKLYPSIILHSMHNLIILVLVLWHG
ncbi:lysostaphin resistance A-like protein [Streptococcus equinus]|uniref:CPBP family intramembrane glutamic endopeptidase n=1 Tax=Streptococcus equinus TaxID=1335 RepID=UPI00106F882C|nr:CPBP family intramembrane glutamic endopeptidase [Streptococcus equinus]TFH45805.1 CPBP family intramembrane metalloprotease [Streptococcus equinus]